MDNLTHTLIGMVAGEAVARCVPAREGGLADPERRTALLALGMVGGNLPDVDLLWSMPAFTGDPLTYLVEHRGYTHTLVGCVVLSCLLLAATLMLLRWRGHRPRPGDIRLLGAMALLSVLLHLAMDAFNEYGVHPFWPLDNRWFFGDSVFIVEPLCWLAIAPLLFHLRTRAARVLAGVVLAIGSLAVLVFHRFGLAWLAVPALAGLLAIFGRRTGSRVAAVSSVAALFMVVGTFSIAHAAASRRVQALAASQFPAATLLDIVLSPAPAHPFCWEVMLLQRQDADYIARIGQLNLLSEEAPSCARPLAGSGTAPLRTMNLPVVSGMRWNSEYTMEVASLSGLMRSNCDTRRLASFVRAPFAARAKEAWILGDLRFDRESGLGFAEMTVDRGSPASCARPPWDPPRADLGFADNSGSQESTAD